MENEVNVKFLDRFKSRKPMTEPDDVFISASAVSPASVEIWKRLPEEIKKDSIMSIFNDYVDDAKDNRSIDESRNDLTEIDETKISFLSTPNSGNTTCMTTLQLDDDLDLKKNSFTILLKSKVKYLMKYTKIIILAIIWLAFTIILIVKDEKDDNTRPTFVPVDQNRYNIIINQPNTKKILIEVYGPFVADKDAEISALWIDMWIDALTFNDSQIKSTQKVSEVWRVAFASKNLPTSKIAIVKRYNIFDLMDSNANAAVLSATMKSNMNEAVSLDMNYDLKPINATLGMIFAGCILIGLYVLIITEIVHRTFAAVFSSTLALAALAVLDQRPTMKEVIEWIDVETLLLLFSMMIIVAILTETGIFDYMAVFAYKITYGKIWPLITCLSLFTGVLASLLDNVTTILLMTPVTIRLCEVMNITPVPILILMVIFSNIGGTVTPIGDPPNVMIASNPHVIDSGVNFGIFTVHMGVGLIFVCLQTYFQFRFYYKNIAALKNPECKQIKEQNRMIYLWQEASVEFSKDLSHNKSIVDAIFNKINKLKWQLKKTMDSSQIEADVYNATLAELTEKYGIRDKNLLAKCAIVIAFVITIFFLHSLPELQRISLGWTALLGAILLILLTDRQDMEIILSKIEWTTLLFFTSLFILMEALTKLGLISLIGKQTENIIMSVSENSRLTVAILIILWVSALTSAFVDNIPLTTMMIKIAISLGSNPTLQLPLQPLMWALSFGACLGGNGTLIGASANIVCAGIAEKHGYRISFTTFFKMGFPIMLGSITVATVYLLTSHVLFKWN
ncbi:P protein-like isoform X1 [Arctopsyche grandis]|uniref:P protein-like isoform X1 n=2 Tax=Arctopsyche grandis TaxID=121162 RepID=UPI00406D69ED